MSDDKVIEGWVDAEEIRLLAERLMAPPRVPPGVVDDPAYGPEFEGFADVGPTSVPVPPTAPVVPHSPVEPVRLPEKESPKEPEAEDSSPPEVVQANPFEKKKKGVGGGAGSPFRAAPSRDLPVPKPQPRGEAVPIPVTGGGGSLGSFVDWLKKEIPLEAVMICGKDGAVLFDDLQQVRLASVARMLAGAVHRKGEGSPAALVVKTGSKRVLQVVPFEHGGDRMFAALSLPRPLADGGVRAFVRALVKALG